MPPRKTNNAAKFIVSLKQNNSERFTINGLFTCKTTKFVPNALAQLWTKRELQYLEKCFLLCRVLKFVIK